MCRESCPRSNDNFQRFSALSWPRAPSKGSVSSARVAASAYRIFLRPCKLLSGKRFESVSSLSPMSIIDRQRLRLLAIICPAAAVEKEKKDG